MKMRIAKIAAVVALIAAGHASIVSAQGTMAGMMPAGVKVDSTTAGPTLVNAQGMTLYTWGSDSLPGKSACNGQCATNWPALTAPADAKPMGDWTIITRDDGSKQWAYKGKPLYTFKNDMKKGDAIGNGRGQWKVAQP
jgi:predicted lipoprotein with Yx(FWY)xxD motif